MQSGYDYIFEHTESAINISNIPNVLKKSGFSADVVASGILLTALANYDTYYWIIDTACDVYFDTDIALNYLAIATGTNFTMSETLSDGRILLRSSNSIRYRKTENNLPTENNKLSLHVGDVVAITVPINNDISIYGLLSSVHVKDSFKSEISSSVEDTTISKIFDTIHGVVYTDGNNYPDIYEGKYATPSGLSNNQIYVSYGMEITEDTNIYTIDANMKYFSICVYNNKQFAGGVRYRRLENGEDTLPYESNKIRLTKGQYVIFTVRYDASTFSVMFEDYVKGEYLKSKYLLSDVQINQVREVVPTTADSFIKYRAVTASDRTEEVSIYFKNAEKYTKWLFVHTVLPSINSNVWRLQDVYGCTDLIDSDIVRFTSPNAEWEMAIHLANAPDFIGGRAHGSEVMNTDTIFLIDGKVTDITTITQLTEFKKLQIFVKSDMFDPSDEQTIVGEHIKRFTFESGIVRCEQYVKWLTNTTLTASYMAMSPPLKTYTQYIYRDSDNPKINNGFPALINPSSYPPNEKCKNTYLYGADSGFWCRFSFLDYTEVSQNTGVAHMTDNGGQDYNKCYYYMVTSNDGAFVHTNDVWHTVTEWEYRYS